MRQALVIAHRGASGYRPEHSASAYRLALRLGADGVETDVVASRDGVLVCRHDVTLSRTTDVAARPEFRKLRRTLDIGGRSLTDWFVHDFTWAQLAMLKCRERWPRKRSVSAAYDRRYPVISLTQLQQLIELESDRLGRGLRLFVELKEPRFFEHAGLAMSELAADHTGSALTWMSFDPVILKQLRQRGEKQIIHIAEGGVGGRELRAIATYADGVAVRRRALFSGDDGVKPTSFVAKAGKRGLDVYAYTHRAENQHLPKALRSDGGDHEHGDAAGEARLLFESGVTGVMSDFPDVAVAARAEVLAQVS